MVANESIHRRFARNLFSLCLKSGSIAETCRQLGINRQQFNKYLAGTTLPSSATLLKISQHFGIDQSVLFDSSEDTGGAETPEAPLAEPPSAMSVIDARIKAALNGTMCTALKEGCYNLYFPGTADPGRFTISAMLVKNIAERTVFVRISSAKGPSAFVHKIAMRHEGLALEVDRRTYLIAKNVVAQQEITLLSFGEVNLTLDNMMSGVSLTLSRWGQPMGARIVGRYLGPLTMRRQAIESIGAFPIESPLIPDAFREAITAPLKSTEAVLFPFDFFDRARERYT